MVKAVRSEVRIPVRSDNSADPRASFIYLDGKIQEEPVVLIFDTGSSSTLLRSSLRKKAKSVRCAVCDLPAPGTSREATPVYRLPRFQIGDLDLAEEPVIYLPDASFDCIESISGMHIDGILGASLLWRGELDFRGPEKAFYIRPFEQSTIDSHPACVPLGYSHDVNSYLVRLEERKSPGEGKAWWGRLVVDTGSEPALQIEPTSVWGRELVDWSTVQGQASISSPQLPEPFLSKMYPLKRDLTLSSIQFPNGTTVHVRDTASSEQQFDIIQRGLAPQTPLLLASGSSPVNPPQGPPQPTKGQPVIVDGIVGVPVFWSCSRVILNHRKESAVFEPPTTLTLQNPPAQAPPSP
jgi:hypothetical protein